MLSFKILSFTISSSSLSLFLFGGIFSILVITGGEQPSGENHPPLQTSQEGQFIGDAACSSYHEKVFDTFHRTFLIRRKK